MKKYYRSEKDRLALREKFFRRLGPAGETLKSMFGLVDGINFNMIDDQDRIMAFNHSNCENCNFKSEDEIIGHRCQELFPSVLSKIYTARNRQVRETGTPIIERRYTHGADRSTDIKIVSIFPLRDTRGKIIGTACMNRSLDSGPNKPNWYGAIRSAISYIDNHFSEKISVLHLAQISNMSISVFRRMFTKVMETTPAAYITTIRVNKARKLLAETSKTIEVIALECGFYDQSHFIKMFARSRRQSPSEYRMAHQAPAGKTRTRLKATPHK